MNIKSYMFRLMITGIAFLLGISAQHSFKTLDRISRNWLHTAAAAVKKFVPFEDVYEKLIGSQKARNRTTYDLTGEYYLSEEVTPIGFDDFARIEFTTYNYSRGAPVLPAGAVYADRKYKFISIAMDGDCLTFETEEKGGVSYRFAGRVVQNDEHEEDKLSVGDLVGRLELLKNGSTWATIDTTLFLFGN